MDQGHGQLLHHLISSFRILHALYFLDKRGADGMVGGGDVYYEGLASIRFMEDRW